MLATTKYDILRDERRKKVGDLRDRIVNLILGVGSKWRKIRKQQKRRIVN